MPFRLFLLNLLFLGLCMGESLDLVKTDNPRDTMRTFMTAMDDYRKGVETADKQKIDRLSDAIRALNLENYPFVLREERGKEAAVLLKEVIDRVIVIDYAKIPERGASANKPLLRWRLKGTEIAIARQESGERAGEYLFTKDTVDRADEFYERVKDLPYLEGSSGGAFYNEPWAERFLPSWIQGKTLALFHWQWVGIFLSILLGLILKKVIELAIEFFKRFAKVEKGAWYDKIVFAVEKPIGLVGATVFWFFSLHLLHIQGTTLAILGVSLQIVISFALIWLAYRLSDTLTDYLRMIAQKTDFDFDDELVPLVSRALRVFVVIFGVLIAVQNLGINVMSVLAGLGLGGLAFALAAKDTAANLFGSIMIIWDKPFRVGDWIVCGSDEGTVEEVGFRSTRIRTFYNSQISVPNSVLANLTIDNMGRRRYRRIRTTFGLTYDTPPEKMEAFLEGVKNIVQANPYTRKDYYHVVFSGYGASSLDVLLYCFLEVPDWATELVERQNVYLEVLRLAKKVGVDFAYPTQSLHIESFPEKEPIRKPHEINPEQLKANAKGFGKEGADSKPSGSGIFVPPYRES